MATNAIASSSKSGPSSPSRKTTLVVVDTPSRSSSKATLLIVDSPAKSLVSSDSVARPRPIPNSYWATPFLLACEYPWTPKNPYKPKLDALLQAGVRTFIDLTESGELLPYYTPDASNVLFHRATQLGINPEEIEYHRFPIRDRSLPNSVEDMYAVLEVLRDNEMRGRIAAVHCRGGIGRTGMVIGCHLVQSQRCSSGEEALAFIAREWRGVEKVVRYPCSPETGAQCLFVRSFRPSCDAAARRGVSSAECH